MLSCDYNGWTDAPEDEREELDRYFSDSEHPVAGGAETAYTPTTSDAKGVTS